MNLASPPDTEGFKEGLKYLNDLYANGLIDPAAFTQDLSQLGQLANIEPTVLGCYTAGHVAMGVDTSNLELSKNYDYLLPLEGPTGYRGIPAVTKQTFQHPQLCDY